jgi:hypothetical protein
MLYGYLVDILIAAADLPKLAYLRYIYATILSNN